MTDTTTSPEDFTEESGTPIGTVEQPPTRTPITITPPPLSLEQAEKLANAIKALDELIDSLGTIGGAFARLLLGKVLEGLRAMGPIPPIGPPMGTQEPSTPPSTTP